MATLDKEISNVLALRKSSSFSFSHSLFLYFQGYEVEIDNSKIPRTIIRHIVPGSPAFVSGLYPGDCILEVNGKDTHHLPVHEVVSLIQNSTSQFGRYDHIVDQISP